MVNVDALPPGWLSSTKCAPQDERGQWRDSCRDMHLTCIMSIRTLSSPAPNMLKVACLAAITHRHTGPCRPGGDFHEGTGLRPQAAATVRVIRCMSIMTFGRRPAADAAALSEANARRRRIFLAF